MSAEAKVASARARPARSPVSKLDPSAHSITHTQFTRPTLSTPLGQRVSSCPAVPARGRLMPHRARIGSRGAISAGLPPSAERQRTSRDEPCKLRDCRSCAPHRRARWREGGCRQPRSESQVHRQTGAVAPAYFRCQFPLQIRLNADRVSDGNKPAIQANQSENTATPPVPLSLLALLSPGRGMHSPAPNLPCGDTQPMIDNLGARQAIAARHLLQTQSCVCLSTGPVSGKHEKQVADRRRNSTSDLFMGCHCHRILVAIASPAAVHQWPRAPGWDAFGDCLRLRREEGPSARGDTSKLV